MSSKEKGGINENMKRKSWSAKKKNREMGRNRTKRNKQTKNKGLVQNKGP